jgi:hypothetical protein
MHLLDRFSRRGLASLLAIVPYLLFAGPGVSWAGPGPLTPDGPLTAEEQSAFEAMLPAATKGLKLPAIPSQKAMIPQVSNAMAALGMPFTDRVKEGYDAFMKGDTDRALTLLDAAMKDAWGDQMRFRLSLIRVDLLARTDRIADAETTILDTARLELEFWDKDLLSRAARGDVRARLGDRAEAEADLARVALAQKHWQLATEFEEMPNITDIVVNIEAKYRATLGLASLYIRDGQYAKGLAWAVELERHFVRLFTLADNGEYGDMVPLLPEFYLARGENLAYLGAGILALMNAPERAAPYFAAADGFFKATGYAHGRAVTAALRARALHDTGRYDEFEAAAVPAIALAAEAGLGELVWRLEALRGQQFFLAGKMDQAEVALRRAQAAVTLVSGALASDQSKLRFGVGKEKLTQLLAAVDLAQGQHGNLFQDMEQGRARAFIDMLANQAIASGSEAALMAEIKRLERDIRRQRLANALPQGPGQRGGALERELLRQHGAAVAKLRRSNPEVADALSVSTIALAQVQAQLGPGEMLAYAVPAAPGMALNWLLVEKQNTRVVKATATQADLAARLEAFADAMAQGAAGAQQQIAALLADQLGIAQWRARKGVYVVPVGNLYFVPWGALDTDYFVTVLPMGGWLNRPPAPAAMGGAATVVGDPTYFGQLAQLPGARVEAKAVAGFYGVRPLLGDGATEVALRQTIGTGVGVLHLATHGSFDADDPLNSEIVLAGEGEVVRLTAARLFEAPLRAGLVVLSACETGVGRAVAGDDFLGLTRSFYLGGARTVLNSLWPVEDKGTQAFMTRFHDLARNGDYGAAWLAARNEAKQQGFPPSVYGAFTLGGSARR